MVHIPIENYSSVFWNMGCFHIIVFKKRISISYDKILWYFNMRIYVEVVASGKEENKGRSNEFTIFVISHVELKTKHITHNSLEKWLILGPG